MLILKQQQESFVNKDMNKKFDIFQNGWSSKVITAHLNEFNEAIDFIQANDCNGLQLQSPIGVNSFVPDFIRFEAISKNLTYLSIDTSGTLKQVDNFHGIYLLDGLEKLGLAKENFEIDLSKFRNLKQLGLEYWSKVKGLSDLRSLEILVLRKYKASDLSEICSLAQLKTLHVYQSQIITSKGIEALDSLEELTFAYDRRLENISESFSLKNLRKIRIEKCDNLSTITVDKANNTIKEFFISKINSIQSLVNLKALELLTLWELVDGDLNPILKMPSIKEVRFHPHKKHYTHTKEEINNLIKQKK